MVAGNLAGTFTPVQGYPRAKALVDIFGPIRLVTLDLRLCPQRPVVSAMASEMGALSRIVNGRGPPIGSSGV